jgi:AcrR family transcriptional regulator
MAHVRNPSYYPGDLRQALLDAAKTELAEAGVGGVSLRSIARRAGVSHAAPAHHFGDRGGLFTELARQGFLELARALREAMEAAGPDASAVERLRREGLAYVDFAEREPVVFDLIFRSGLCKQDDPGLREAADTAFGMLVDAIAAATAEGWGAGSDPDMLALLCWSTVHGFGVLRRDGQMARVVDDAAAPEAARAVVSTLTAALAAGPA